MTSHRPNLGFLLASLHTGASRALLPGLLDAAAVALCSENKLPIVVFDLNEPDNVTRVARGERVGTLIAADPAGGTR